MWHSTKSALQFLGHLLGENALRQMIKAGHIKAVAVNRGTGKSKEGTVILKIAESELLRFSRSIEEAHQALAFKDTAGKIIAEFIPTTYLTNR